MIKLVEPSLLNLLLHLPITPHLNIRIILGLNLLLALLPRLLWRFLNHFLIPSPSRRSTNPAILLRLQHRR